MGLFRDRWDSENYPSYEDYMDAKRNGTLNTNRQYINTPTSSEQKANLSSPAPHVADEKYHTLESQTASIEAKTRAASVETKAADAKRFRDTSSKYGEPKPFVGRLPKNLNDKQKQFKWIAILLAIIIGVLPAFSRVLDAISEQLNLGEWIESLSSQETQDPSAIQTTAATEELVLDTHITTALPADYVKISNALFNRGSSSFFEVEDLVLGEKTSVTYGIMSTGVPYLESQIDKINFAPLYYSTFINSSESSAFFNSDGSLTDNSYIEIVLTDLTKDGYKEILVYYYNDMTNPYVEIFYNAQKEGQDFKSLDYFESTTTLNITEEGIIQRIDDEGKVYDEIEVTADGVYLVEN